MEWREVVFPDPELADDYGVVAWSQELDPSYLYAAYSNGIFPWPCDSDLIPWFSPAERAVLDFENLHISRSLRRQLKKCDFTFKVNSAFEDVIRACSAAPRKGQDGTWITDQMIEAYVEFHHHGYAGSFETWQGDTLVGGMYGVSINGQFAGESMFHHVTNASKFALISAVEFLGSKGLTWIDVQQLTPLLESFGAHLIPRSDYLQRLNSK